MIKMEITAAAARNIVKEEIEKESEPFLRSIESLIEKRAKECLYGATYDKFYPAECRETIIETLTDNGFKVTVDKFGHVLIKW